ncbi:MAG TPA: hypothetical protein VNJ52_02180 [Patescibacteria group bacterium]|nr:hypothetical protein [Patescibacteria group bacterium]
MIASLILVVSIAVFVQFFVFYTRSLIAASCKHNLSEGVCEITGITGQRVQTAQFARLLQLVELCPGSGNDEMGIRAVRAYFSTLSLMTALLTRLSSAAMTKTLSWAEGERASCAYFAATVLDQRMAYSRTLLSHGTSS